MFVKIKCNILTPKLNRNTCSSNIFGPNFCHNQNSYNFINTQQWRNLLQVAGEKGCLIDGCLSSAPAADITNMRLALLLVSVTMMNSAGL